MKPGPEHAPKVIVLFGPRPDLIGRAVVDEGRPPAAILPYVRSLRR